MINYICFAPSPWFPLFSLEVPSKGTTICDMDFSFYTLSDEQTGQDAAAGK